MIQINDKSLCSGCSACQQSCPKNAIVMKPDSEGFLYPSVDRSLCIDCHLCEKICPFLNLRHPYNDCKKVFAVKSNNLDLRLRSSSGGAFAEIASFVLKKNGVVYGAAFTNDFLVEHIRIDSINELHKLQGSKYLQSNISNCFKNIKEDLFKGKFVVFSGSTCQVAGLIHFLGKPYDNLLTIDFICEGVPSPKIWSLYLSNLIGNQEVESVNFKDKSKGWHNFSLSVHGKKTNVVLCGNNSFFFNGYFNGLYSRPSCHNCVFKQGNRVSDITISDCWGAEHFANDLDDNKGLSSVIIHNQKGYQVFFELSNRLTIREYPFEYVLKYNPNYSSPKPKGRNRQNFWNLTLKGKYVLACKKYCRRYYYYGFKGRLRRLYHCVRGVYKDEF